MNLSSLTCEPTELDGKVMSSSPELRHYQSPLTTLITTTLKETSPFAVVVCIVQFQ